MVRSAGDTELVRSDPVLPSEEGSGGRLETSVIKERVSGVEMIPVDEGAEGVATEGAPAIEGTLMERTAPGPVEDVLPQEKSSAAPGGLVEGAGSKRPPPSDAPAPVPKKSRASKRTAPTLPPLEQNKTSVVPLLSVSNNDILNAEDITHQFLASVVAEMIRERMFGGVAEALDPRLLALTGLLASSTQEQVALRA